MVILMGIMTKPTEIKICITNTYDKHLMTKCLTKLLDKP